ncbi:MAG: MBL fold metallo-hydrolase [Gammaproteobacteria bacterium]|nr:MAG: MBL fold metallo-hydrolase [Gammaproteobacteria bacterium]
MQATMNSKNFRFGWLVLLIGLWAASAQAFELLPEQVDDNVWALVGEIRGRTPENHALNNTLGFVITPKGVILIGSGATPTGAALIERTIAKVTDQPIRWLIDIGAQDHHWLGNSYFAAKGIPIIALARTVAAQKAHVDDHLARLKQVLGEEADDVHPVYANRVLEGDRAELNLGRIRIELIWPGNGHFPGDAVAWLPDRGIVFAGDFVFNDRILGVHPFSNVVEWRQAFERIAALHPRIVVPGHGHPGSLAKAQRDTGDYLDFLVEKVGKALEDWKDLGETTDALDDAPQFQHLKFYKRWHRTNINRTYLQMEAKQ